MASSIEQHFSASDLERIAAAVHKAEGATSGEIVPYVVPESDHYLDAAWRVAFVAAVVALLALSLLQMFSSYWVPYGIVGAALTTVVFAALCGIVVALLPGLRCMLAGAHTIAHRTGQRALEAFVSEEVFNTRDRTGILLFVSMRERKVLVLGDSGINAKVPSTAWEDVVATVVNGMRAGKTAEALIAAIEKCGELLQAKGVELRSDDANELPDSLRFGDAG